jgi:hypothetical protein
MTGPIDPPYPRLDIDLHRRLCDVLLEIRLRYPDFRLGQLLALVADDTGFKVWDAEDWELLPAAEAWLERCRDRVPDVGPLAPRPAAAPGAA